MCSHVYDLVRGSTALSSCVLLEGNALTSFIVRHNYHTTPSQEVYWHAKRDLHTMNTVVSLSFFADSQIHAHTALCWAARAQRWCYPHAMMITQYENGPAVLLMIF